MMRRKRLVGKGVALPQATSSLDMDGATVLLTDLLNRRGLHLFSTTWASVT